MLECHRKRACRNPWGYGCTKPEWLFLYPSFAGTNPFVVAGVGGTVIHVTTQTWMLLGSTYLDLKIVLVLELCFLEQPKALYMYICNIDFLQGSVGGVRMCDGVMNQLGDVGLRLYRMPQSFKKR